MPDGLNLDLPDPEWIALLREEVAKGRTITEVAREVGIARASLSMLLSGTYPAQSLDLATRRHAARVVQLLRHAVACPHLMRAITREECRAHAGAPMSTSSPERLRHWRACRGCALNPFRHEGDEP